MGEPDQEPEEQIQEPAQKRFKDVIPYPAGHPAQERPDDTTPKGPGNSSQEPGKPLGQGWGKKIQPHINCQEQQANRHYLPNEEIYHFGLLVFRLGV